MKTTIEIYDTNILNAFQYRLREVEWEIHDRFFGANVEMLRISRILKKHIRHLQYRDPIFAEYHRLTERLNGARALTNEAVKNMMGSKHDQLS